MLLWASPPFMRLSNSPTPDTPPTTHNQATLAGEAEAAVRQEALERMEQLRTALLRSMEILHSLRALFELKPTLTHAEFQRFVQGALARCPELLALAWIQRLPHHQRAAFEQNSPRKDNDTTVQLREIDQRGRLRPAAERPEYWPLTYVEPAQVNHQILGLDVRTNPCRRHALEQAALSAEPVATSPLNLAQLGQRRLGFLVVLKVGEHPRPEAGWVSAAFRLQNLAESIFAPLLARGVHLQIQDLGDQTLPPFSAGTPPESPSWIQVEDMPIAGRSWRFTFKPSPLFRNDDPVWLARAASELQRSNTLLEQRVAARTAELEAANRELRAEAALRQTAEQALARADAQLSLVTEAEARQWKLAGLVGLSERFVRMLREVRAIQTVPRTTVLLTGETGTGKELIARAIHYGSAPVSAPFIRVECATLLDEKSEVLLFGRQRSAGLPEVPGYCALAEGGTLFFDEIGDLPPRLQARLLRVMEDGAYHPTGSDKPLIMKARVIAATHADLRTKIAAGTFREDLYYRLLHYHIPVPSLRERLEDIPLLAQHFVRTLSAELKRPPPRLRPDTLQKLLAHTYPGNIRELKNTLERSIIYAGSDTLGPEHISFAPHPSVPPTQTANPHPLSLAEVPLNLAEAENVLVARAMALTGNNISKAARLLGVNRTSLYRWQEREVTPARA